MVLALCLGLYFLSSTSLASPGGWPTGSCWSTRSRVTMWVTLWAGEHCRAADREVAFAAGHPSCFLSGWLSFIQVSTFQRDIPRSFDLKIFLFPLMPLYFLSFIVHTLTRKYSFAGPLYTVWSLFPRIKTLDGQKPYLSCSLLHLQCLICKKYSSICWRSTWRNMIKCFWNVLFIK